MKKKQTPAPDLQCEWDRETLADFAGRCQRMTARLRELRADEQAKRQAAKEARRQARDHGLAVEDLLARSAQLGDEEAELARFASKVKDLVAAAEIAAETAREAKQIFRLARAKRQGAADELRVFLNSYLQRLPLFDGQAAAT